MLVEAFEWEKIVSDMGIANDDKIIIYDNSKRRAAGRLSIVQRWNFQNVYEL